MSCNFTIYLQAVKTVKLKYFEYREPRHQNKLTLVKICRLDNKSSETKVYSQLNSLSQKQKISLQHGVHNLMCATVGSKVTKSSTER